MGGSTKETGKIIICMEVVYTHGEMVEGMKENTLETKSMGMECIIGQMEESTKATGKMGNSMEKENTMP